MTDLAAIRERHNPTDGLIANYPECAYDGLPWPCDTAQVLAALEGLALAIRELPGLSVEMEPGSLAVPDYISRAELLAILDRLSEPQP